MTGKGPNGNSPHQNLAQLRSKPVFDTPAEPERTKCPYHPTKRMWTDERDAIREAEARSIAAKIPIAAYRCEGCENIHLAKRQNVREGSLIERPHVEEPELPLVLGNAEAKRKVLAGFLAEHESATTDELVELLGVGRKSITPYMAEAGWYNTRGRHARWVKRDTPRTTPEQAAKAQAFADQEARDAGVEVRSTGVPPNFEVFKGKGRHLKPVDDSMSRHPSAQHVGWMPMENLNPIIHIPLGDVVAVLKAAGLELRLQTRAH